MSALNGHRPLVLSLHSWRISRVTCMRSRGYAVKSAQTPATYEERLEFLDMLDRRGMPSHIDHTKIAIPLLNLHMPVPFREASSGGLGSIWRWCRAGISNGFWNAFHLHSLARKQPFLGIPGLPLPKRRWSPQILRATSLSDSAWTKPVRKAALAAYIAMNEAQAKSDVRLLSQCTRGRIFDDARERMKKRSKDKSVVLWKYQGPPPSTEAVQCLSIRSLEDESPVSGEQGYVCAQALMRFDTMQSLSVHDKRTGAKLAGKGSPEEPVRVTEYMVLEAKISAADEAAGASAGWYIRDQMFPGSKYEEADL